MRVGFSQLVDELVKFEMLHLPADAFDRVALVQPVHAGDEMQEFPAGELVVQKRHIGDVAQQPAGAATVGRQIETAQPDVPRTRPQQADEHFDGRGLARSVGPQQSEQFASRHAEIQAVNRHFAAVGPRDVFKLDHGGIATRGK